SPYADSGETEAELPSAEPEQVATSALAGLSTFVALEPDAVIEAYEGLMELEPGCPEDQDMGGEGDSTVVTWFSEGCTTSGGLEIRGGGRLEHFSRVEGDRTATGAALSTDGFSMHLAHADGRSFEMTGYLYYERGTSSEGTDSVFEVSGSIAADPETAAASPLLDASVSAQGFLFSFSSGAYVALGGNGAVSGPVLGQARAFQFSDLLLLPAGCAREPAGTLSVRDDEGFWHDIVFDAAILAEDEEPMFDQALCDGCGAYVAAGQVLGEACVAQAELQALMQWEQYPW
ncbi:MAG: hypothetical protein KDK70_25250, partial [Myxococcales bacterium]|nr:hypothetical protein [Myxococcales bacterium]